MSLDVYLNGTAPVSKSGSGIFVRENGKTVEISEEEWKKRYPNRDPVRFQSDEDSNVLYHDNITHNLGVMANRVGLYEALWRPDEMQWTHAREITPILEDGLQKLEDDPDTFNKLNPENGWGSYDGLIEFVTNYLAACKEYPDAVIEVSR